MGFWRLLLGADIVGDDDAEDETITVKGICAKNESAARQTAERIAKREGISGRLEISELPDPSGGSYYRATWRK